MLNLVSLLSNENRQSQYPVISLYDIGVGLLLILLQGLPGPNIGIGFSPAFLFIHNIYVIYANRHLSG